MVNVVKKVNMLILMQPNFEDAVEFYKALGLKLSFHLKEKWAEFGLNGVNIGLCPTSEEAFDKRTGIVLQVENVKDFFQEHKDKVTFLNKPFEAIHGIMVSFRDPGGNIIDLYQPTPKKVTELVKKTAEQGCCKSNESSCQSAC